MEDRKRKDEMKWGKLLLGVALAFLLFGVAVYGLDALLALLVVVAIGAVVWKLID